VGSDCVDEDPRAKKWLEVVVVDAFGFFITGTGKAFSSSSIVRSIGEAARFVPFAETELVFAWEDAKNAEIVGWLAACLLEGDMSSNTYVSVSKTSYMRKYQEEQHAFKQDSRHRRARRRRRRKLHPTPVQRADGQSDSGPPRHTSSSPATDAATPTMSVLAPRLGLSALRSVTQPPRIACSARRWQATQAGDGPAVTATNRPSLPLTSSPSTCS
jgi:hypothetical protein